MTGESTCDSRKWGFVASNVPDPPRCIARCRHLFRNALAPGDETLHTLCKTLSKDDGHQLLWDLYCCDAQICGVYNVGRPGDDRAYERDNRRSPCNVSEGVMAVADTLCSERQLDHKYLLKVRADASMSNETDC